MRGLKPILSILVLSITIQAAAQKPSTGLTAFKEEHRLTTGMSVLSSKFTSIESRGEGEYSSPITMGYRAYLNYTIPSEIGSFIMELGYGMQNNAVRTKIDPEGDARSFIVSANFLEVSLKYAYITNLGRGYIEIAPGFSVYNFASRNGYAKNVTTVNTNSSEYRYSSEVFKGSKGLNTAALCYSIQWYLPTKKGINYWSYGISGALKGFGLTNEDEYENYPVSYTYSNRKDGEYISGGAFTATNAYASFRIGYSFMY